MRRTPMMIIALLAVVGLVVGVVFIGGAGAGTAKRHARLSGAEEVPGPGDEDGSGRAVVRLNAKAEKVCFTLRWRDIGSPTMAHIHEGAKGVAGDIVVGLFMSTTPLPDTIHKVSGCVSDVDAELIQDIKRNSSDFYVNIHNEDFPGGAIRGQLKKR